MDGELSQLESALLDAHLGRCADCRAYEAGIVATAMVLRSQPAVAHPPVRAGAGRTPSRFLAAAAAAALVVLAALLGGLVSGNVGSGVTSTLALRNVAVVANVETPDQLRRLRRTALLNERLPPREIAREPY